MSRKIWIPHQVRDDRGEEEKKKEPVGSIFVSIEVRLIQLRRYKGCSMGPRWGHGKLQKTFRF
ncbi:hypothetical protein ACFL29_01725 [Patescibacteria group bacterium]